jgi:hypothetical protein
MRRKGQVVQVWGNDINYISVLYLISMKIIQQQGISKLNI